MIDHAGLAAILQDLADSKIDVDQASRLILDLKPTQRTQLGVEALYDDPPTRAASGGADDGVEGEPVTAARRLLSDEPPRDGQSRTGLYGTVDSDADQVGGEQSLTAHSDGDQPEPGMPGDPADDRVAYSMQIGDLALTATEVLKEAGSFAKGAALLFGRFAGSVLSGAPLPDRQPQDAEMSASEQSEAERPSAPSPVRRTAAEAAGSANGIDRLVLRSVGRRVRLIGDPKVATIVVDGPHSLRRQGATLEVNTEGELGLPLKGLSILRPPRSVEDLRTIGLGKELVVRINPLIQVDAEVTGSRLTTVGVPHLGKVRVSAGGADLSGVVELADALVQAGGASVSGPLGGGRSQVRVESGNLSIRLSRGANVTVRSKTQLGRVSWPGEPHGDLDELVVGSGAAQLDIGVVMGRVAVVVED